MAIPASILLVDDQAYVRRTLRSLLAQQKHWVIHEAADGKAAVQRAREIKPDIVVMDIVMPGMNGIEAAYELRQVSPESKVLLMSSYYTPQEALHLSRLFGNGRFVPKSETGKKLVPAISDMLPPESQAV